MGETEESNGEMRGVRRIFGDPRFLAGGEGWQTDHPRVAVERAGPDVRAGLGLGLGLGPGPCEPDFWRPFQAQDCGPAQERKSAERKSMGDSDRYAALLINELRKGEDVCITSVGFDSRAEQKSEQKSKSENN